MLGSSEGGDGPPDSLKTGILIDQLNNFQFSEEDSVSLSQEVSQSVS
jgi:hypothetical protein